MGLLCPAGTKSFIGTASAVTTPSPTYPCPLRYAKSLSPTLSFWASRIHFSPPGEHEAVLPAVLPRPTLVGPVAGIHEPVARGLAALTGDLAAADRLLADRDLVLCGLGQRHDLLHLKDSSITVAVRLDLHAADVQLPLVEPKDGGRQFLGEVRRDQHDPHVEHGVVPRRLAGPQELEDGGPGIAAGAGLVEVRLVRLDRALEGHPRDHRGVADRLELHMPALVVTLELDHDEAGVAVDPEQIDAPLGVLPLAELLGDDENIGGGVGRRRRCWP